MKAALGSPKPQIKFEVSNFFCFIAIDILMPVQLHFT